ncbi:hypothetical protein KCP75_17555 [Salmonella enterica subsp. enterica]|nr:hypothetical protein KCP75_17555 [Salmonella enterica subsp. enterica]
MQGNVVTLYGQRGNDRGTVRSTPIKSWFYAAAVERERGDRRLRQSGTLLPRCRTTVAVKGHASICITGWRKDFVVLTGSAYLEQRPFFITGDKSPAI